ncbi:MAG: hypothetical protein IPG61_15835 [bacterium]|nr:hypothetical protein [bacterium]
MSELMKRQAAGLAADRAAADAGESVDHVELGGREIGDDAGLVFVAELAERADEVAADRLEVREIRHLDRLDARREFELGAGHQPVAEMVVLGVEGDGFGGHAGEGFLEVAQVAGAADLEAVGVAENEVAEAEVGEDEVAASRAAGLRDFLMMKPALRAWASAS